MAAQWAHKLSRLFISKGLEINHLVNSSMTPYDCE